MKLCLLTIVLVFFISCNGKKNETSKCLYKGKTWIDLDESQKKGILGSEYIDPFIKSVFIGDTSIIDGTIEKKKLIRNLASPNCHQFPLYQHLVNLILSDSILIYSDKKKISHYNSVNELGYTVIQLFEDYPQEMYRSITESPDNNFYLSGALVAGFYEKSLNIQNDIEIPDVKIDDFFIHLEKNIDFNHSIKKEGFNYFRLDIETEIWRMLQEN